MKISTNAKKVLFFTVATLGAPAFAEGGAAAADGVQSIFDKVDFSSIGTFVVTAGVAVIGIRMSFKGIDFARRAINKA